MSYLFRAGDDWTEQILDDAWTEIETIARDELKLTYYKPQIEIVTAKQMLAAYSSVGMPTLYKHWSFGKDYVSNERAYRKGEMGLAYEMVINSDPCIAYLMEENNALVQTMVMAHASVGHAAVFKHNYLFKDRTDAGAIIDYLSFAKSYLKMCEEKYGEEEVEAVLDSCHALQSYGLDKYRKAKKLSVNQEEKRAMERFERELGDYDPIWEKVGVGMQGKKKVLSPEPKPKIEPFAEPQENLLYFIEKNAPHLPAWKREVIRINRKLAHYFSPQGPTKVLNEGFATFIHYHIMRRLEDKQLLDGGSMLEFFSLHAGVINQPPHGRFNPYKLGFSIFMDIKRMCEAPTDEDRRYFPRLAGQDWLEQVVYAMENFKDETFILQYLSPKVARDLQLFSINDPHLMSEVYEVTHISNESGFYGLRERLAKMHAIEDLRPDVQITAIDAKGTRRLLLEHFIKQGRPLELNDAKSVLSHVAALWEYSVTLKTHEYNDDGELKELNLSTLGKYSAASTS